MKRAIIIFIILTLINPPVWATQALAPGAEDWKKNTEEDALVSRRMLGLNLPNVKSPADVLYEIGIKNLPQALAYRKELMENEPKTGRLAYLYAVTEEKPVKEVLDVINEVKKRISAPIRAVVVLGIGGQSLGNKAVVQILGSDEVKFIFPDNIANPQRWLAELEGIKPENVLLYVSSKTGSTDETMANFWFFWEWMIQQLGQPQVASRLLEKLQGVNLANVKLNELVIPEEEKVLLQTTLNRIAVSTTPEKQGPIYNFAVNNNIPIVPLQAPVEGRYTVLFRSGQFTTALAGHDIEKMRQAILPLASSFKENNPELNPALETAMYAYAAYKSGLPILAAVSSNEKLVPLFEWARQLVNESLGKEGRGPYFTFASGSQASQSLMKASKDKLFLVINVGEEKLDIPEGASAVEINIPEINAENLARIFLFLEEFTVRYGTLVGVNPVNQPWVDRFKEILTEKARGFDISHKGREARRQEASAVKEFSVSGGLPVQERLLARLTKNDELLTVPTEVPENESKFQELITTIGEHKLPGELEGIAQNLALQLYTAEKMGKRINSFFIYSANPKAKLVGEFIKYLGQRRMERLKGGGILWDYIIGTTDQHSTAQFLGAGADIAITTFLHFLQEPGENPPIIRANGLINERLDRKTPKEINTLYLQAVREALNNEGRITNTIEAPNEKTENLEKLYQLLVRISELYTGLWENEDKGGTTLGKLVSGNESVVIETGKGVKAGSYGKELQQEPVGLYGVTVPMYIGGVVKKTFIHPQVEGISGEVSSTLNKFISRVTTLARTVTNLAGKQGSALNRFVTAEELKEQSKPEFYAFRLEDAIAKIEVGSEVGNTLWEEIRIRAVNTMIAKTVQEIRRINKKAKIIVYTKDEKLKGKEYIVRAALDAIDCGGILDGGIFDLIVCGDAGELIAKIVDKNWATDDRGAREKTVFASTKQTENAKTVIVPNERFIPFPELATVMQAMLRTPDSQGKLPKEVVEGIVSSYTIWLELAGFSRDEIRPYIEELRQSLLSRSLLTVSLPIPPTPKAGSVIQLLDKEYEEVTHTKSFA